MAKMAQYKEKLLNEFESREDEWTYGTFEQRLGELRKGTNYQDAKGIIIDAYNSGRYPNVVKRYLFTNFKIHNNVSSEFTEIFNKIYSSMPIEEKKSWGIA